METLGRAFVRVVKRRRAALCMADTTGCELTFGRALIGSLLLSRIIRRRTAGEDLIGLLLPASVGGALANIATTIAGKAPVNLNFTAGRDAMTAAVDRCGIRTILTSRVFLSKAGFEEMPGMVFLEDLLEQTSGPAKIGVALATSVLPAAAINRLFVHEKDVDSLATVIFSSGSTGVPKGVMLSHRNIRANINSAMQVFELGGRDVMLGVLPFFHRGRDSDDPRRSARVRRHVHAGRSQRRAARGVLHRSDRHAAAVVGSPGGHVDAETVSAQARGSAADRRDSDARHRQNRSARRAATRAQTQITGGMGGMGRTGGMGRDGRDGQGRAGWR